MCIDDGFFLGKEVLHLAADEVLAAGGVAERADEGGGEDGLGGVGGGEERKGVGEQGVAGEQRGGFVEGPVGGGAAAAQVVVVHTWQVVVDERVGVDAFEGDGGGEGVVGVAKLLRGGECEDGTEAFASGLDAVAHGGVEAAGDGGGGGQVAVETELGPCEVALKLLGEVHAGH